MMLERLISIICLIAIVSLSGCASLNSDFECPLQPGIKCKSIDEVNDMINQGQFGLNHSDNKYYKKYQDSACLSGLNKGSNNSNTGLAVCCPSIR